MNAGSLVVCGLTAALVVSIWQATERFISVPIPELSAKMRSPCTKGQDAQSEARWEGEGQRGYITGHGSLILQRCTAGTWVLDVTGISLDGIAPRLLVESGSNILLDQTIDKHAHLSIPVKAGFPLAFTVPNATVRLEDRNLYISKYRFSPNIPCLQNPPQLSSKDIGILENNRASITNNGSFFLTACGDGNFSFTLSGSNLKSVGPEVSIKISGSSYYLGFIQAGKPTKFNVSLHKNDRIDVSFTNDGALPLGERNITINNSRFR